MLKESGFADCIPKLAEKDIADPAIFFELEEDTVIGALGIETEGKKFRIKKKLAKVKEEHEKMLAQKEQGEMAELNEEVQITLNKHSSIQY